VYSLSALKVSGNKIVDSTGKTVVLRGINRSGTEFACIQGNGIYDGPSDANSIRQMKTWKINVVRVPLNEDCWLGINGVATQYGGAAYQNSIRTYVNAFVAADLYVILDLHWTHHGTGKSIDQQPMPDRDHAPAFWTSVANAYKDNGAVLFDIFNEPFPNSNTWDSDSAWSCWKTGGNSCSGLSFVAAGMQELVTAVRDTGANNIVLLGGLAYSNSLAQFNKYVPTDSKNQIVASWHSYNFNYCKDTNCWNQYILPVVRQFPVLIGEVGENDCAHGYIDGLMNWADTNGLGYLGWTWNTWNCRDGPALITNYDGTATAFGQGFKDHLNRVYNATSDE
jgi:hypothetical protein